MKTKLKPLAEQVMVITGASSGIGLAAAQAAAKAGAKVVLVARTEDALQKVEQEIVARGGQAIYVVADVGDRGQLQRAADAAIARFGGIDTWVNDAGVGIWGKIDEVSEADMRQLFDTNFWGVVNGSLIATAALKQRGGGALINIGSMASDRAIPLQGIYSASKHAIKGFTNALRMELEKEGAPISVTLIKPASIGTPMPQHVKNYTQTEPKFPPPVYTPEAVAEAILKAAVQPRRDIFIGSAAAQASALNKIAPRALDRISEALLFKAQQGPKPPSPGDNLRHGMAEGEVRGDHQGSTIRPSLYTKASLHPALTAVALTAAGLGLLAAFGATRPPGARMSAPSRA